MNILKFRLGLGEYSRIDIELVSAVREIDLVVERSTFDELSVLVEIGVFGFAKGGLDYVIMYRPNSSIEGKLYLYGYHKIIIFMLPL